MTSAAVDPDVIERLRAAAARLAPALADAPVVETWSGLRPGLRGGDGPLIAEVAPGVVAATGHYRNGVLLAPVTARRTAELVERAAALSTRLTDG